MNNPRQRILMLVPFLHYQHGGMERQAWQLAQQLAKKGVHVTFLTCLRIWERKKYGLRGDRETVDGIEIIRLPGVYPPQANSFYPWEFQRRARRQLASIGPIDLIHAHQLFSSGLVGVSLKERLQRPLVVKIAGSGGYGDLSILRRRPFLRAKIKRLKAADRFIALNQQTAEEMAGQGFSSQSIVNIPNGVDTDHFRPSPRPDAEQRRQLGLPAGRLILSNGRIVPQKNTKLLVGLMPGLLRRFPDVHLVHIGKADVSSPYAKNVKVMIQKLGLTERVHLLGTMADIRPYLAAADAFVLTSVSEGLSNALLEAAAAGRTIVASDIPGNQTVIRHQRNGLLFDPTSQQSALEAVITVLGNEKLAGELGTAARQTALERFSLPAITDRYIQLYQELTEKTQNAERRTLGTSS